MLTAFLYLILVVILLIIINSRILQFISGAGLHRGVLSENLRNTTIPPVQLVQAHIRTFGILGNMGRIMILLRVMRKEQEIIIASTLHNQQAHIPIMLALRIPAVMLRITTYRPILQPTFGTVLPKQCVAKCNKRYKVACLDALRCHLHY